jgi:hypothetical protein
VQSQRGWQQCGPGEEGVTTSFCAAQALPSWSTVNCKAACMYNSKLEAGVLLLLLLLHSSCRSPWS